MTRLLKRFVAVLIACACMAAFGAAHAQSERLLVVVSDLHVGAGKTASGQWAPIEDFRWQADFNAFLNHLQADGIPVDLVFAGDVFELWQSPTMQCSTDPRHSGCTILDCKESDTDVGCSEAEALARLTYVVGHHQDFLDSIKAFAAGKNRVYFVPGNHDAALLFPKLQAYLSAELPGPNIHIASSGYWLSDDGKVFSNHGHQFDLANSFKGWPTPFTDDRGVQRIVRPWGENMVQQFYDQYEFLYPIVDNISSELDAIRLVSKESTLWQSVDAASKFFKLIIFQDSIAQTGAFLGQPANDGVNSGCAVDPKLAILWNCEKIRTEGPAFFSDLMINQDDIYQQVDESMRFAVPRRILHGLQKELERSRYARSKTATLAG
jgi:UDP-2,3-diacylglucosamine pyrophosphatase LpxH